MHRSRPRAAVVLIGLTVALLASFSDSHARTRGGSARGLMVRHDFGGSSHAVRDFWTRQRMRAAPPMPEPKSALQETDGWSASIASQQLLALRTALLQDAPFERREIEDPTVFPYRVHGKLFVQAGRALYHCSATVVKSANESVVFTAGHCLYGEDIGGWVDSVAFVPGYEAGARPYGTWVADSALVTPAWLDEGTARGDIGALVMEPLNGVSLVDTVGARKIAFDQPRELSFEAYGYPAEGDFDGETLYVCVADAFARDSTPPGTGPDTMGIGCDMTQGSSGGGWVIDGTSLNSVNSYGYRDDEGNDMPYMFGPYFGNMAQALFQEAAAVPVEIPEPVPSASASPTELPTVEPSASPSPSPTVVAPRMSSVGDANDSRGLFDISSVSVTEQDGQVTVDLSTYDQWGSRLLSAEYRRNLFVVDFDSVGGPNEDYYLAVFSRNGRLIGRVHDYAPGADPLVGRALLSRPTRDGFSAVVSGDVLQLGPKLRWFASSFFKTTNRCRTGCTDYAPNRTLVEM